MLVWLLFLLACGTPDPSRPGGTSQLPLGCPTDMVPIEGGRAWLGALEGDYGPAQIPYTEIALEPYCIDAYPFPGQRGDDYPVDGLAFRMLPAWDELLQDYGRRLCTPEELLWASTSGATNLPFAAGAERSMLCEPFWDWERMSPFGSYPACVSPWGLYEFNVFSSWASASAAIDAVRGEPHPKPYDVVGGTNRDDTYYDPTNFGIHSHGMEDFPYFDDQLRVCADPGPPEEPADWLVFRQAAANQGSFGMALAWHRRFGPGVSPSLAYTSGPMPEPEPWW